MFVLIYFGFRFLNSDPNIFEGRSALGYLTLLLVKANPPIVPLVNSCDVVLLEIPPSTSSHSFYTLNTISLINTSYFANLS